MLETSYIVSKLFLVWILCIIITFSILLSGSSSEFKNYYQFGQHKGLIILGIEIDTISKYLLVVSYSFVNSIFRTLQHNYIKPWMITNIYDEKRQKDDIKYYVVYDIVSISIIYNWIDLVIYMNIILSQIDMFLFQILGDLCVSYIATYYYMRTPKKIHYDYNKLIDVYIEELE
jgi:hypothetical protein